MHAPVESKYASLVLKLKGSKNMGTLGSHLWFRHSARQKDGRAVLITLDVARAYNSVDYGVLLDCVVACNIPHYSMGTGVFARLHIFFVQMSQITFFRPEVSLKGLFSLQLFNILLSSILRDLGITVMLM